MDPAQRPPQSPVPPPPIPAPVAHQDAAMRLLLPVGRSGWAIAAGYLGLFSVLIFPAPFAVVLGILAIIDIRRHPHKRGLGRAIFGLAMGAMFSSLFIAMMVALSGGASSD